MSLVSADNHFAVFASVMVIAAAAFLFERTRIGAQLTGTVVAILLAILAANLGLIPHSAPAYGFIFSYVVPTLIPLFLFQADLRRLIREASRTTLAFFLASLGTVLGVALAASLLNLETLGAASGIEETRREAAVVGLFASTYIGGSVNYAALGDITGLSRDASFFSAATAADNLFSAVYLSVIALLPGLAWLSRRYPEHRQTEEGPQQERTPITATSLCLALASATSLVAVSDALVAGLGLAGWRYIILTSLALALATLVPKIRDYLAGAFEMGVALSFAFFVAIAAGANVGAMIKVAPILIVMVLILLSGHLLTLLLLGKVFRLTLPELLTASNAAILGATTAPAMAAAKGWRDQVTPGVLVGVFGYALGTFVGTALYEIW